MRKLLLIFAMILLVCSTPGGFTPVENSEIPTLIHNDVYQAAEAKAR